jgi:predicted enzyme related to lactoylglutathione lyase
VASEPLAGLAELRPSARLALTLGGRTSPVSVPAMERNEYAPGTPSWVDLGTSDLDAAAAFYEGLFGWDCQSAGPEEETGGYRMFFYKGRPQAGLGPQQNPGPPYWTTYVSVADADETAAKVEAAGGMVFVPPMDVLDVGRMAVFADPAGAVISIWQPGTHPGTGVVNEPNTLCWNELSTRDTAAAQKFYEAVFGWGVSDNAGGQYFEWQNAGATVGGMMPMPPGMPSEVPSHWLVYFAVSDTDAAVATATKLGGGVTMPATDLEPGRIAVMSDPQGAMFAVITMKEGLGA